MEEDRVTPSPARVPKKNRNVRSWNAHTFVCEKEPFEFALPCSHVVIPDSHIRALENDRKVLKQPKESAKSKQFTRNASDTLKACLAIALAAVPAFAMKAAGCVSPLLVTAFLKHCKPFDRIGKVDDCAMSFPSESFPRKNAMDHAADDMVWPLEELESHCAFLACDEGMFSNCWFLSCCFTDTHLTVASIFHCQATRRELITS